MHKFNILKNKYIIIWFDNYYYKIIKKKMIYADIRRINEALEYKIKCLEILSEENS